MMSGNKHPLEIEVTETSAADCPHILIFSFVQEGERKRFPYEARATRISKVEDYWNRKNISPDLSALKTSSEAQKFKEEFLKQYPVADKVYEHLFEFGKINAKSMKIFDKINVVNNLSYGFRDIEQSKLSPQEKQGCWDYMRRLCEAKALGMELDNVPASERSLLHVLGIKKNPLSNVEENIKGYMERSTFSKEIYEEISHILPEKVPQTEKQFDEAVRMPVDEEHWKNNARLDQSISTVVSDFIDIKIKEDAEKVLDGKLRVHLQKLEKEKKVKRQLEEKKAEKIKTDRLNKSKGAEAKAVVEKKRSAQDRLAKKGLMPKRGEKSGNSVNWGDGRKQGR